jgi:hypothetical protein
MNIYLIYFMIAVIFIIVIHSYYLPKNKYCHLNSSNNEKEINNNAEHKNIKEGFDGHTEQDRRYIKISDLKDLEKKTYKQISQIDEQTEQINRFKENDTKQFYVANSNLDSYKKVKKFIEDEKYNARYHESLREYDRGVKIDNLNTEFDNLRVQTPNFLKEPGRIKNIKNHNADHHIRVTQTKNLENVNKVNNLNNPFTVFVNKGCISFDKDENNNFKVSNMCDLTDSKQQFKFNKIETKDTYNKIVKDSGNEFLYSIPNDNEKINELDQPFYVINPVENIEENKNCLTQLGEYLSVEPCNLHTNQRWIPDFQDKK